MIAKNLALLTLTAPLMLNTTYLEQTTQNRFTALTNQYEETDYDNDNLETYNKYATIEYNTGYIGQNFNIKARSIERIDRYILEQEYIYRQKILIQYENTANLNITRILYKLTETILNEDKLLTSQNIVMQYIPTLTTIQENFINGQNYNTLTEIKNTYLSIDTGAVSIGSMQVINNKPTGQSAQNNILISLLLEYDENLITDTGAFLTNMVAIQTIDETLTYEMPENISYEVVDIPGLMFEVLGMPFAWVSMALNFTIFPGTPYALNISHLIIAVVVAGIAIFIIKRILS